MSRAPMRILVGPNGGGKTWAGTNELMSYATGYNQFRNEHYPTPNVCWASALDHINNGPIVLRTLLEMAPPGTKFDSKRMSIQLPEPYGSVIYLKACESGPLKYQSERVLAVWQDEEWPSEEGLKIWKECMRRGKPGWPLRLFMTMTAVNGFTWSYDYLFNSKSPKRFEGAESFSFELEDCLQERGGFLTPVELAERDKNLSHWERQVRVLGQYAQLGGQPAFDLMLIDNAFKRCQQGQRYHLRSTRADNGTLIPVFEAHPEGQLVILVKPEAGRQYILSADPSMGVYKDNSAVTVWDRSMPVECAYFVSNSMEPARLSRNIIAPLATYYNTAMAVVESNSEAGAATLAALPNYYGHIYMRQDFHQTQRKFTKHYGFRTDGYNRGLIFDSLKECLRMDNFVASRALVAEMAAMIVTEKRIDHMAGKHDDHVIASGIALTVSRQNPPFHMGPIGDYQEDYKGTDSWMGW